MIKIFRQVFFLFLLSYLGLYHTTVYGQNQQEECFWSPIVVGQDVIREGRSLNLTAEIVALSGQTMTGEQTYEWIVRQGQRVVHRQDGTGLTVDGLTPSRYDVQLTVIDELCSLSIDKTIVVTKKMLVYVGGYLEDFASDIEKNLLQADLYLHKIITPKSDFTKDDLVYLASADSIFINTPNYAQIIKQYQEAGYPIHEMQKIVFVTPYEKELFKKFLLTFVSQYADQQFFLFGQSEMINALLMLSVGSQKNYETIFQQNSIIVPDSSTPFSFFSFVDILVVNGFPLELIKILFALMAVCPLIIFWRQWLGFYSFDFFYPLMLALAWFLLPLQSFVFMIGIGMFATIVTALLTKIHLYLGSIKKIIFFLVVLMLTVIVVATLIFLGMHDQLLSQLYHPLFLPLFVVINFVMLRLFHSHFYVREIKRRTRLIQLVVMSMLIGLFLVWEGLHNFFLVYPWVSLLVIGVSFWLTRYLGLQFSEYVRFWSLLTKHRSTPSPQKKLKR